MNLRCTLAAGTFVMFVAGCGLACKSAPSANLVPALIAPADGAMADNGCSTDENEATVWDFDWSEVPGTTAYELWVKHASSSTPELDEASVTASSHRWGRMAMIEGKLLEGWEWKVRAQVNGAWQPWSATGTFNVEPPDTDCR